MMDRILSRHYGVAAICFGGIGAAIYLLMINVTLAHIATVSGYVPFDMRPLGYGPQDAAALLKGLGAEGRSYYLNRQIPLDTLYPAALALSLIYTMRWFGQKTPTTRHVQIGTLFAVGAALFDYGENLGIAAMIWSWPTLPEPLVQISSAASVAKSILTTGAVLCTIFIGCRWGWHRRAMSPKSRPQA